MRSGGRREGKPGCRCPKQVEVERGQGARNKNKLLRGEGEEEKSNTRKPRAYKPKNPTPIFLPQTLPMTPAIEPELVRTKNPEHETGFQTAKAIAHVTGHVTAHVTAHINAHVIATAAATLDTSHHVMHTWCPHFQVHYTAVLRDGVYAMPLLPSVRLGRREGAGE